MARPMDGVNGNFVPALPLEEVRRFVDACRPIFAQVNKLPHDPAVPACENTGSSGVGSSEKDFTIAFSSGFIGARTTTRRSGVLTLSSWRIVG